MHTNYHLLGIFKLPFASKQSLSIQNNQIIATNGVNLATATTHHIGEESPTAEAKRKAEATTSKTKGKWLKITRKGLLVSAIGRVGKHSG